MEVWKQRADKGSQPGAAKQQPQPQPQPQQQPSSPQVHHQVQQRQEQQNATSEHNHATSTAPTTQAKTTPIQQQQPTTIDPIQSIANVLNQHSKFVQQQQQQQQQKKSQHLIAEQGNDSKLDQQQQRGNLRANYLLSSGIVQQQVNSKSSKSSAQEFAANEQLQVDQNQGNSYLYAYNEFVTPPVSAAPAFGTDTDGGQHRPANSSSARGAPVELSSGARAVRAQLTSSQSHSQRADSSNIIVDSDEDDSISYISHQHKPYYFDLVNSATAAADQSGAGHRTSRNDRAALCLHRQSCATNQALLDERDEQPDRQHLEAPHRIDHHLTCSRSIHLSHICGIGGRSADNLSSIAARLREASQRAFVLNQRSALGGGKLQAQSCEHQNFSLLVGGRQQRTESAQFNCANDTGQTQAKQRQSQFASQLRQQQLAASGGRRDSNSSGSIDSSTIANETNYLNSLSELHLKPSSLALVSAGIDNPAFVADVGSQQQRQVLALGAGEQQLLAATSDSGGSLSDDAQQLGCGRQASLLRQQQAQPARSASGANYARSRSKARRRRRRQATSGACQQQQQPQPPAAAGLFGRLLGSLSLLLVRSSSSVELQRPERRRLERSLASSDERRPADSRKGRRRATNEQPLAMYSQQQMGVGGGAGQLAQLAGQAGAYYAAQTPQSAPDQPPASTTNTASGANYSHSNHQAHHSHNHHHHSHHHHHSSSYPLSSDSSSSSLAFASSSASRFGALLRGCCSRKGLSIFCLTLILLIFIFVGGLIVYLKILIDANKTNLVPLSGRLKVDAQGDSFSPQLSNRTSKEFLAKQQQYETILRGAFDRTQPLLKTYPDHLVKCEVYSFRQGSLWVYFRLFLNKKSLMQDSQLMKRKSPDELLDRQFLPRLTQQTLHAGFEQLVANFELRNLAPADRLRASRSNPHLNNGGNSNSNSNNNQHHQHQQSQHHAQRQPRASWSSTASQRDHVKSFDEQISRLMPIIESIDLQSIQVSPEFDMLQVVGGANLALRSQESISDNLLASQVITAPPTTTSTSEPANTPAPASVMVATGSNRSPSQQAAEYDVLAATNSPQRQPAKQQQQAPQPASSQPRPEQDVLVSTGRPDELSVSTKKFTLYPGYRENATRPATSTSRPTGSPAQQDSLFLLKHQQKRPPTTSPSGQRAAQEDKQRQLQQSQTVREIVSSRTEGSPSHGADQSASPASSREKLVKLLSGQPVVSQARGNVSAARTQEESSRSNRTATALFAHLSTGSQQQQAASRGASETTPAAHMVAPYQKLDFSSRAAESSEANAAAANQRRPLATTAATTSVVVSSSSSSNNNNQEQAANLQELWNSVLSAGNGKRNSTSSESSAGQRQQQQQQAPSLANHRLIAVATIVDDENKNKSSANQNQADLDWQKISLLSSEISDTIRAQMNANPTTMASAPASSTTTSAPAASAAASAQQQAAPAAASPKKPKVAPHLHHGGSLISPQRQQQADQSPQSAVLLNRDFQRASAEPELLANRSAAISEQQQQVSVATRAPSLQLRSDKQQQQRRPQGQRNSTLAGQAAGFDLQKQQRVDSTVATSSSSSAAASAKPIIARQQKPKKPSADGGPQSGANGTAVVGGGSGANGSRLAHNGSSQQQPESTTARTAGGRRQHPLGFSSDRVLPPTVELTRATTARAKPAASGDAGGDSLSSHRAASNLDFTTSPSVAQARATSTQAGNATSQRQSTASPAEAPLPAQVLSGQTPRPGTSNFSNQWRPLVSVGGGGDEPATTLRSPAQTTRKPSLAIILGTERLPPTINVPSSQGSQSPFAMSAAVLDSATLAAALAAQRPSAAATNQQAIRRLKHSQQQHSTGSSRLSNAYHAARHSSGAQNEFESHRVSRMKPGELQRESPAPTLSPDNTRMVDDFMITTTTASASSDNADAPTESSTQAPPAGGANFLLRQPGSSNADPIARIRTANSASGLAPRRTRGPFAFETLKATSNLLLQPPPPPPPPPPTTTAPQAAIGSAGSRAERSPLSNNNGNPEQPPVAAGDDQKLLVRKKLLLGDDNELSLSPSSASGQRGVPAPADSSAESSLLADHLADSDAEQATSSSSSSDGRSQTDRFGNRKQSAGNSNAIATGRQQQQQASSSAQPASSSRCQYYGCKAKGSMKFICLNYTQICDDFIDCQDQSDELDCVSLLKHDSKTNRLSFSNGAGIIYLNRKGALAPMCIDYFADTASGDTLVSMANVAHDLDSHQLDLIKKQQELIRQINTIGQYACSLQSFSRLVSVKINHHSLVDNLDLIKTSKMYHRLAILGESDKREQGFDASLGSYKSGSFEHEVEVSTSPDCPSKRTVFVKCGSFECGQDSFSVSDQNSAAKRNKNGVIINDFPWLVKLYWLGSLSCHGYLIDELWLMASSECFVNKSRLDQAPGADGAAQAGWSAEISYEHYGNDDYQSIESNRRNIQEILEQPPMATSTNNNPTIPATTLTTSSTTTTTTHSNATAGHFSLGSSIVLAKLEKPVRFSPLNRPICLPLLSPANKSFESQEHDRTFKDCVTATLPAPSSAPTQDLLLTKAKVHTRPSDCVLGGEQQSATPRSAAGQQQQLDDLICVSELANNRQADDDEQIGKASAAADDATRVLICSTVQTSRSRAKWTVVGVQSRAQGLKLDANKQLFTTVSSQLDWIVDTMNPKSNSNLRLGAGNDNNNSNGNELNPLSSIGNGGSLLEPQSRNQTCNHFKCFSGECLSWSRICDGLYDCSSHDDEKDCHK